MCYQRAAILLLVVSAAGACRTAPAASVPPIVQPGAPGEPPRAISAAEASDLAGIRHTEADVRFMQGMIAHHAQALDMAALVPDRTSNEQIRLLARRIELSQADEIALMRRWLQARGENASDAHAHHGHGPAGPGMLTAEEMRRLAEARGLPFDRLFLELMIKHHDGALLMVEDLLASPGAAQEPGLYAFVSDLEGDQRMEISRMRRLLAEDERR